MNREAAKAVESAIAFEGKKDGLQQRQDGSWTLRVTVASIDMDQRLTQAPMGTRYQIVAVEISDDETPVDHKAMARDKWRDLGPAQQAALRCKDPVFWAWLTEQKGWEVYTEEAAAIAVRALCDVASRSELGKPGRSEARLAWHDLDFAFQAWKVAEHG